ncbi:hypothetical protein V1L54_25220 [Streptomyces sp. TRM 70361]|nr:hypothetical protein [Streptomyces sp. TRM 70361]MEE1942667.1 hypothetical protein [Streptomyces sp. TRM 70361]
MTDTEAEPETPTENSAGTEACEHLETEKRDGKTHCRACDRQIYL